MQAKRKFLPILLVAVALAILAACNGGGGGQGRTWFNLPSLPVNVDASGAASVYGIGLGQVLTPDQVRLLQSLGQRVELRVGHNGIHVYINGEDQAYLAWDDESAANLAELLKGIPGADAAAQAIPWLRRIGLGAAVNVPPAQGQPLDIPRWRGETSITPPAQPPQRGEPLVLGLSFDERGSGAVGGIPGEALAALLGTNPLQLDPGTIAQLRSLGLGRIAVETTPTGLSISVDGKKLPGIAYDATYLQRLRRVLPAVLGGDANLEETLGGVLEQLPNLNLALNVDLTGAPTELKLPDLPLKVGEDGSLEVLGLSVPGLTLPAETLKPLRDLGVEHLALSLSTEDVIIAIDGQALPHIRFGPNGLNTLLGVVGGQANLPKPLLDAVTDAVLKDGVKVRLALAGDLADVAVPEAPRFTPADLGNLSTPVIRASVNIQGGRITAVGGLTAEQLAALGVELPALPPDVMKIFSDLGAKTVDIVNSPNNLSIQINGTELLSMDYDAASLAHLLELAKPYLAGTPLEDPAVMKLVQDVILPIAPAADVKLHITIE
ncbi:MULTISPECIES: hypothetical protein [Caldilinea]|jgi:hypothetical protein|uniref:Uncharacterized protein n=1 Tax=Caldilinea aerophila (strain DSM 14535 / JCM 11387 / NBRC 104270 / STL-6-O1) TaxID=926550 RepID=I0I8I5_CALAS|nr:MULTISPECIES: hypothetical protein [Caldilinea]MBO9391922.1 hypothetical protein [Caldilinea sp.]BAM01573.1 hypothetical protein CLDAP_35330 [Caldilinea aerophila DSM 14535 = NBRC 104270]